MDDFNIQEVKEFSNDIKCIQYILKECCKRNIDSNLYYELVYFYAKFSLWIEAGIKDNLVRLSVEETLESLKTFIDRYDDNVIDDVLKNHNKATPLMEYEKNLRNIKKPGLNYYWHRSMYAKSLDNKTQKYWNYYGSFVLFNIAFVFNLVYDFFKFILLFLILFEIFSYVSNVLIYRVDSYISYYTNNYILQPITDYEFYYKADEKNVYYFCDKVYMGEVIIKKDSSNLLDNMTKFKISSKDRYLLYSLGEIKFSNVFKGLCDDRISDWKDSIVYKYTLSAVSKYSFDV